MRASWMLVLLMACGGSGSDDALDSTTGTDAVDATTDVDDVADVLVIPAERVHGERRARTARCEPSVTERCLVWPSNALTRLDPSTATGLRLALADDVLPADEGVALLEGDDGFSRVAPIVVSVPLGTDPAAIGVRLFVAEGDDLGAEEITRRAVYAGRNDFDPAALVVYPTRPLAAGTEHLVVVTGLPVSPMTDVALGRVAPTTDAEAAHYAYHAVARAVLAEAGVDAAEIARLWDFTTRSASGPLGPLSAMADAARAAVDADEVDVVITSKTPREDPIALIVEGHVDGIPDPTTDATYTRPFRVVVPAGDGDYRIVMYAHGAGGNVRDASFDGLIAEAGAAKVNLEIDGWTDDTIVDAVGQLFVPIVGADAIVARMRRSLAGGVAIQRLLRTALGDLLAAETGGRRPIMDEVIWAGGSLGGVTGMVYGHLEPSVIGGLLNVPGAGFTHWLSQSVFYEIIEIGLESRYPAIVDLQVAIAMTQQRFDEVDGASWALSRDPAPIFLVQMSVGDPVMPNVGTAMVATALQADIVGGVLVPVAGLVEVQSAAGKSALTEYETADTSTSDIHGFAATDSPAGVAARDQFAAFITSLWSGAPLISVPDACLALTPPLGPAGTCDFKE